MKHLIPCLTLLSMLACAPGDLLAQSEEVRAATAVAATAVRSSNYVLAPNDVIEVNVFQEKDLSASYRISKDGTITFPLIGSVTVGGRTAGEASNLIRTLLEKDYLVNPQVNVTVTSYSKRRFTILGQVARAGAYDFPDNESLNLLQAIGMAGGYTRIADPSRITLKRRAEGREVVYKLNAKAMARDENAKPVEVQPGDTITVGESLF